MNKKISIAVGIIVIIVIGTALILLFQKNDDDNKQQGVVEKSLTIQETENETEKQDENILTTIEQLNIQDIDGKETNYMFTYKEQEYKAIYTTDNWHIENSYQIRNYNDMEIICEALINIHPIHGKDKVSYRTVDDLVYEWELHNIAYDLLPEDNKWKSNVKHVDLNPEDQGKDLAEMYKARIERNKN
ncbi:MAG: hypothetical protein IKF97_03400 [Clostridia bacterium]|nr:hypothetical protein [Clostridia bacterium]